LRHWHPKTRIFSYADAHRYRLGTHYEALPVNAPKCPANHYHKDGVMRFFANFPNPDYAAGVRAALAELADAAK